MIGLEIPDAYASALLPLLVVSIISAFGFLFRQIGQANDKSAHATTSLNEQTARTAELLAAVTQELKDMHRRLGRLEDYTFPVARKDS